MKFEESIRLLKKDLARKALVKRLRAYSKSLGVEFQPYEIYRSKELSNCFTDLVNRHYPNQKQDYTKLVTQLRERRMNHKYIGVRFFVSVEGRKYKKVFICKSVRCEDNGDIFLSDGETSYLKTKCKTKRKYG